MAKEPEFPFGVRLTVAYDGSGFHGWQSQDGYRTVQSTVEAAIVELGLEHSGLRVASRTDAGVHALGQVAAFGCKQELPMEGWVQGLNNLLPGDVVIKEARPCFRRFNPRWHASKKRYRYVLYCGDIRDPMLRDRVWHIEPREARKNVPNRRNEVGDFLDVPAMRAAAECMVGTHDFVAFRGRGDERQTTERTMFSVTVLDRWEGRDDLAAIEVTGNAFMKNMVRIMVGTLVEVGTGKRAPESIPRLVDGSAGRQDAGQTAPPHGLTLVEVELGRDEVDGYPTGRD